MKYKISKSGLLDCELRRIAAAEVRRARNALSRKAPPGIATESVHKARKHLNKIRGLLRLARPALGRKAFTRENLFFRDIGREIRAARDSVALIESLDNFTHQSFAGPPPVILKRLRHILVLDARKIARQLVAGGALARVAAQLDEKLGEIKKWKFKTYGCKDARRAWRNARDASLRAFAAAKADPTDENLHEWRKRAKTLLCEMLLLRSRCPDLCHTRHEIEKLAESLGEDHDLCLLEKSASAHKEKLRLPDELKTVRTLLLARRKKLRAAAFTLAAHSLAGDPGDTS